MSLWKIAWRSIQQRALASSLTGISMALGVMLIVAMLTAYAIISRSFNVGRALPYDVVVGKPGGDLQMVLNAVYYMDKPVENLPFAYYEEFLPKLPELKPDEKRDDAFPAYKYRTDREGRFASDCEAAIPVCLGDYCSDNAAVLAARKAAVAARLAATEAEAKSRTADERATADKADKSAAAAAKTLAAEAKALAAKADKAAAELRAAKSTSFRVIGTTPQFFEDLPKRKIHYDFMEGHAFAQKDYFDVVIGSIVAQQTDLKLGDKIKLRHGSETGDLHGQDFTIVGILAPLGTPIDKGFFINMEGDFKLEGHVGGRKEVTSILVRLNVPVGLPEMYSEQFISLINKDKDARAVQPIGQIARMFDTFINPLLMVLLVLAVLVVIVSGIGILVSIYNSMSERQHEIAVMRALGAGRSTVMRIVLLESILLALGGGLLGIFAGHALILATGPWITSLTGFPVSLLQSGTFYELILVPGLIGLAALVGFLPALSAYRTDVAKALTANP